MSTLVDELKDDHKVIVSYLESARNCYGTNPDLARQKLFLAKETLLKHLKKEDEVLYPALNKEGQKNSQLKNYLDVFAKDMEKISALAIKFFEKYKDRISPDFSDDFATISFELKQRIGKEERVLYKEFDKIEAT